MRTNKPSSRKQQLQEFILMSSQQGRNFQWSRGGNCHLQMSFSPPSDLFCPPLPAEIQLLQKKIVKTKIHFHLIWKTPMILIKLCHWLPTDLKMFSYINQIHKLIIQKITWDSNTMANAINFDSFVQKTVYNLMFKSSLGGYKSGWKLHLQ